MNYTLAKYKGRWAVFCARTRCFVLFGAKRELEKRVKELNQEIEAESATETGLLAEVPDEQRH